eukprot:1523093-Prymnesium_polylepis.1
MIDPAARVSDEFVYDRRLATQLSIVLGDDRRQHVRAVLEGALAREDEAGAHLGVVALHDRLADDVAKLARELQACGGVHTRAVASTKCAENGPTPSARLLVPVPCRKRVATG